MTKEERQEAIKKLYNTVDYIFDNLSHKLKEEMHNGEYYLFDSVAHQAAKLNEIYSIVNLADETRKGISKSGARKIIAELLSTYLDAMDLRDTDYYKNECLGWRKAFLHMNYGEMDEFIEPMRSLYETWKENIHRGSNQ